MCGEEGLGKEIREILEPMKRHHKKKSPDLGAQTAKTP